MEHSLGIDLPLAVNINHQAVKILADFCKEKNLNTISDLLTYNETELKLMLGQEAFVILKKVLHDEYSLAISTEPAKGKKPAAPPVEPKKEKDKTRSGGGAPPAGKLDQGPRYGIGGPGFSGYARKHQP